MYNDHALKKKQPTVTILAVYQATRPKHDIIGLKIIDMKTFSDTTAAIQMVKLIFLRLLDNSRAQI